MPVLGYTKVEESELREITDDDKHSYEQLKAATDKILADSGKARYKIELMFVRARSMWKPTWGVISLWESGAKLHGGGDGALYICPGKKLGRNECDMPIPSHHNAAGHMLCPHCGTLWKDEEPDNVQIGNHTMRTWADILYKYYRMLDHNADIYLKHSPDDIRSVAMREQTTQCHGDLLNGTRSTRALHIYPLENLIKDTASGADISGRLYSFLTA